jgi:thioesterase superfamily protein 4
VPEDQPSDSGNWLAELRDPTVYTRIDEELISKRPDFVRDHVIHDALKQTRSVQDFHVYVHKSNTHVAVLVRLGGATSGHRGVVHGGLACMLMDEAFGWLSGACLQSQRAFTANLNVNFKQPLPVNSVVVVHAKLDKIEGRKMFMSAELQSLDKSITYSNATTLFVVSRGTS